MVVLKNDYSHCPLKKRPLSICYESTEQTEPQDLSLKCGKEAPLIHQLEPPFVQEVYSQVTQLRNFCVEASCRNDVAGRQAGSSDEEGQVVDASNPKNVHNHLSRLTRSEMENGQVHTTPSGSSIQNTRVEDCLAQRKYAQVIKTNDTCKEGSKRLLSDSTLSTNISPSQRSPNSHEMHNAPKYGLRRKENSVAPMTCNTKNESSPDRKKVRSDRLHPLPSTSLVMPTCSKSHSYVSVPLSMDIPPLRVPPPSSDILSHLTGPLSIGEHSASSHSNILFTPHSNRSSSDMRVSPIPSAPHRPWLSEGPQKPICMSYPSSDKNPYIQTPHSQSLLVGPSSFWAGMVPFSWPMPPILNNPRPPSPRRLQRECYSPGSESASSDGSSSSVRSEARYSCTECNKSYSTYSGLSKHKQFHCSALGAKSFGCKHCEKVYTSLGALKMHIRTHTLPCKCPLCGKAFSRPWLLQGHIRTHTGEKPFQCPQCDRCFADRSNLRAHLQTHADIKKYACSTCQKTFSRMSLLKQAHGSGVSRYTTTACTVTSHQ
ncbi:uncharacterized protein [Palaemon carinicauda]|uniref:uncharacterized protein n=1 Tax=Palaemon carinicauda TaxID=392227 RepID=UPI0035B5798A